MVAAIPGRMRLAILVLVLLAAPAAARAEDLTWVDGPPGMASYPAPPTVTQDVSYAHQTLVVDGIAAALVTAGALQNNPYTALPLILVGAEVYGFGPPVVHFANGETGKGFLSFGLRFGLPMLGAMVGGRLGPKNAVLCDSPSGVGCSGSDSGDSPVGVAVGLGAGALVAALLDASVLAHKRVVTLAPQFAPMVSYNQTGLSVGLGGSF